ncbi:hypothetical protein [Polyangium sp. 15x6]|uniref:hypothetical protein n=1 Tax=Polyangium sp. 15x6 TaxID=3042687 RepID=UPI00249AAF53|nr:hypothetical protein [Polyangium sp. 15x6]MDI3291233.1 hypothetical protein [Polyangium sp. 15x6]
MEAESIRNKIVEFAHTCPGLGANPTNVEVKRRYIELIAPGEPSSKQEEMAKMSGCALLVGGIWRAVGVDAPSLLPPYKIGTAISRLVSIARAVKAWIPFKEQEYPAPGDMVLVGDNAKGGVEHVYTVVGVELSDGNVTIRSVDGGQRDAKGHQAVLLKQRVWRGRQDCVVNASDPGAQKSGGRIIQGWVDVSRLPFKV